VLKCFTHALFCYVLNYSLFQQLGLGRDRYVYAIHKLNILLIEVFIYL